MKIKQFVYIWQRGDYKENPTYMFYDSPDRDPDLWLLLGEVDISFDLPETPSDEELTNRKISHLRKGREETVKEFATKLQNIDDQIQELLALPESV